MASRALLLYSPYSQATWTIGQESKWCCQSSTIWLAVVQLFAMGRKKQKKADIVKEGASAGDSYQQPDVLLDESLLSSLPSCVSSVIT